MQEFIDELYVEDITTQTSDSLLESLSLEIMEMSINDQINGDRDSERDFLSTILDKFRAIDANGDSDTVRLIRFEIIEWANRLIANIVSEYDLGYNNPGEESLEVLDILESLYHFFILDRKSHTKDFFLNYIDINKRQIIDDMNLSGRYNDVTSIANKKKNLNKYNIPIISNLTEVMQHIINNCNISTEDFINIIDDGDFYTANIRYYFECDMLVGEFFLQYVEEEVGQYTDDVSGELRATIRMHLSV